jgi:predicted metal-dependent peptidase
MSNSSTTPNPPPADIEAVLRSRFDLIRDEPFFGVPLMELKIVVDPDTKTMSTNGIELRVNPAYVAECSDRKTRTVLAHEVMHCGLLHHVRMGQRDLETWNKACDYAVNNILDTYNTDMQARRGFAPFELTNLLVDHQYDGLSAEEIYQRIYPPPPPPPPQQQPQPPQGQQQGQPDDGDGDGDGDSQPDPDLGPGGVTPAPATDANGEPTEGQEEEARWRVIMDHAEKAAKMRGSMPGGVARAIKDMLNPEMPWQEMLRQFLRDQAKDDYTWRKPSVAGIANGMLLPGLRSDRMGEIVVAIDTSGSVDGPLLKSFLSEVAAIHAELRPSKLIVMDCDWSIHNIAEFSPEDEFDFTPMGGGGTSFEPVFNHCEENNINPAVLIYFTDLMGSFPSDPPPYPVLWLDYLNQTSPPWGEHIPTKRQ